MRLIKPSVEILEQGPGITGIYEMITRAGYTCYKTEKEITADSARKFVDKMIANGHLAMLEHGTVYLKIQWDPMDPEPEQTSSIKYMKNPYSRVKFLREEPVTSYHEDRELMSAYITTNLRVLVENGWMDDLKKFWCEPTVYHVQRFCARFICDRGVSHELVRHRVMSFAQESTRYCNYSSDKFGSELTFIEPTWYDEAEHVIKSSFGSFLRYSEDAYLDLLDHQYTPQQARQVLPNALKTEVIVTGFEGDWKHFFDLRAIGTTGKPHPDMQLLAIDLLYQFVDRGYLPETIINKLENHGES